MQIPLSKLYDIRRLLYDNSPSYFTDINNDEQLARLINEVVDIIFGEELPNDIHLNTSFEDV